MFKSIEGRAVPQRTGSEETRRLLVETALRLFRDRGLEQTTIRDIAGEAGLSLGATYYYFKNKEAIVGAYYDYLQDAHAERARAGFLASRDLRARLKVALHSKIDLVAADRPLLRALFRYGGDPDHALSWFGPATRAQRAQSVQLFAEALGDERLPDDIRDAAPVLLWTMHMGILLYFLFDASPDARRTRRLIDAAVDVVVDVKRIATSALLRPLRRRVFAILQDAGLLDARPA